jgi:hypothetical protein
MLCLATRWPQGMRRSALGIRRSALGPAPAVFDCRKNLATRRPRQGGTRRGEKISCNRERQRVEGSRSSAVDSAATAATAATTCDDDVPGRRGKKLTPL